MTRILAAPLAAAAALAGCGDDPFVAATRYRMIGLPAAEAGACPAQPPTAPPAIAGATRARLTYLDAADRTLRCDVVLALGAPPTVIRVPDAARPADLVVEYVDAAGAVVGRGEARGIAIGAPGEIAVRIAPSGAFACAPDRAAAPRAFHSATPLPGGELLLVGGVAGPRGAAAVDGGDGLYLQAVVELYDPRTGRSRPVSIPGLVPRAFHEAYVVADDADGVTVAVLGGMTVSGDPATTPVAVAGAGFRLEPSASAIGAPGELVRFDRATATFARTAVGASFDLEPRGLAAMSPPGDAAIAAAGGLDVAAAGDPPRVSADRVDGGTGLRTATVPLRRPRIGATVTALDGARLVVWGGDPERLELGELLAGWDAEPAALPLPLDAGGAQGPHRAFAAAALAGDGAVIVAGGFALDGGPAVTPAGEVVQRLAPVDGAWQLATLLDGAAATPVGYAAAVRLPDGDVLIAGGNPDPAALGCAPEHGGLACAVAAAWRYDSGGSTIAATGALGVARYGLRLARLADGTAIASGGLAVDAAGALRASTDLELYEPRGAADDPLLPGIVRAPGDVARTAAGEPLAPCDVLRVYDDAAE